MIEYTFLQAIWFLLIGVLLAGYGILDGFDLGVGIQHLFQRKEKRRQLHLKAIGPLWDGNEVWLLTGGGAMFAAFPPVYASVFSGFYSAFMLLLLALIFRAVSLEFRNQVEDSRWQGFWDWSFGLGSLAPALLFGVAVGNIIAGMPINDAGIIHINFFALLNPHALVVGLTTLAFFTMHGAAFLLTKADDEYKLELHQRINSYWVIYVGLYVVATAYTIFAAPYLFEGVLSNPLWWLFLALLIGGVLYTPIANKAEKGVLTFVSTSVTMIGMVGVTGASLFPRFVPGDILENSLMITNSSSQATLGTMLVVALIGVPIMLAYTFWLYSIFWGKKGVDGAEY